MPETESSIWGLPQTAAASVPFFLLFPVPFLLSLKNLTQMLFHGVKSHSFIPAEHTFFPGQIRLGNECLCVTAAFQSPGPSLARGNLLQPGLTHFCSVNTLAGHNCSYWLKISDIPRGEVLPRSCEEPQISGI